MNTRCTFKDCGRYASHIDHTPCPIGQPADHFCGEWNCHKFAPDTLVNMTETAILRAALEEMVKEAQLCWNHQRMVTPKTMLNIRQRALEALASVPKLCENPDVQEIFGAHGLWSAELYDALQELDAYLKTGKLR